MLQRIFRTHRVALGLLFVLAMATTRTAGAESVTLAWDANPESDVVGYYVFIGTSSGIYTTAIDVGTATSYTFSSAAPATTYYLTVAAYVAGPIMGPYAPEIVTTTGAGPTLSNPGSRSFERGDSVSVTLSASDPDGDPVTFGALGLPTGLTIDAHSGVISGDVTVAGTFNVSVSASDPNDNITTQYFQWIVIPQDEAPPTISITSPTRAATYTTSSAFITLSGSATDDVSVASVAWANNRGGSSNAAGTTNWSVVIPLRGGTNVLTVTATDGKNKTTSATLTVSVDLPPAVAITSPTSSGVYSTGEQVLSLGGTASDEGSVSRVTWSSNRGGSGTATGTTSWTVGSIALAIGTNVITVTAQDNAGQTTTAQLSVSWAPAPLRLTSLTANKVSPQTEGTTITFSATATAGVAPYQYKWWLFNGTSWVVADNWSTDNTFSWTPTTKYDGYKVGVWVRSAGQTADASDNDNANRSLIYAITESATQQSASNSSNASSGSASGSNSGNSSSSTSQSSGALRLTSLNADRVAPQAPGTTITFSAAATGGTAPYAYKWWLYDGSTWSVSQEWSSASSFAWTPSAANGNYKIGVWVRSAGSSANSSDNDASNGSLPFVVAGSAAPVVTPPAVTPPPAPTPAPPPAPTPAPSSTPLSLLSLTANKTAPQAAGTAVTFTATAINGSGQYQYKWWLFNGSGWSLLQDWSGSSSYSWTPAMANSTYRIGVWVRESGSAADASGNDNSNGSINFPIGNVVTTPSTPIGTPASPLRLIALTADRTSPQAPGTAVTISAAAIGGNPQYQYKWFLFNGSTWVMVRDWSQTSSITWTPNNRGSYRIGVWVRSGTSTVDQSDNDNANGSLAFIVQ